jgi:hypothetical protein
MWAGVLSCYCSIITEDTGLLGCYVCCWISSSVPKKTPLHPRSFESSSVYLASEIFQRSYFQPWMLSQKCNMQTPVTSHILWTCLIIIPIIICVCYSTSCFSQCLSIYLAVKNHFHLIFKLCNQYIVMSIQVLWICFQLLQEVRIHGIVFKKW